MIEVQPRIEISDSDTIELDGVTVADASISDSDASTLNEESVEQPRSSSKVCRNGKL